MSKYLTLVTVVDFSGQAGLSVDPPRGPRLGPNSPPILHLSARALEVRTALEIADIGGYELAQEPTRQKVSL